jgi:glucose/arabinose dehydrogenase
MHSHNRSQKPPFYRQSAAALASLALAWTASRAQVDLKIHFEPAGSITPFGYVKDFGNAYNTSNKKWGWVTEASLATSAHVPLKITGNARDRARAGIDPKQNTCIYMQYPTSGTEPGTVKTRAAYEYALANGTYKVIVSVGDQPPYNSVHTIHAEGAPIISGFVSTAAREFKVDSATVIVADGKLTIDAIGGTDTRLNYIRVVTAGTPPDPASVDLKINFQNAAAVPPAGYLRDYGQGYALRTGANQGTGLRYGWVTPGTSTPVDLSVGGTGPGNGRNRATPADVRLATFMHMQADQLPTSFSGTRLAGAWEITVPNNWYTITVSVGEASNIDSKHNIRVEGQTAIELFSPSTNNPFFTATKVVRVTDGKLTIDAIGGTNTKIDYALIQSGISTANRASVSRGIPLMAQTGVTRDAAFTAEVNLPNGAVNGNSVKDATVQLFRSSDNAKIPSQVNTSGGGDVVVLQPTAPLDANKGYRFELSQGVQDASGRAFIPYSGHFTTGTAFAFAPTTESFDRVSLGSVAANRMFTSVIMGPDHRLYAGTLTGEILRYPVNADGTLGTPLVITSLQAYNGNANRAIIGMAFEPGTSTTNPALWISNNAPTLEESVDWSGKITRMSGASLQTVHDYVVGLPRATKDHMTNSITFGPGSDHALYVMQGSRSANGGLDGTWNGEEHLLSASVLKMNLLNILPADTTINVKTEEGGSYNPFATGMAVTLYATGVRNAYDLLWHSNGSLYTAGNGSAAGGTTPTTPTTLPGVCNDRIDKAVSGPYTGPMVQGFSNNRLAQADFLYSIKPGKYYGHPNPKRCEWVLNGGNPTHGIDFLEELQYAEGVQPDRNWQRPEYVLGMHFSADGSLEYKSNAFGGSLKTRMLITRYSAGKDILVLTFNSSKHVSGTQVLNVVGGGKFADPLDLAEDTGNGNLYVVEYAGRKITLLKPH